MGSAREMSDVYDEKIARAVKHLMSYLRLPQSPYEQNYASTKSRSISDAEDSDGDKSAVDNKKRRKAKVHEIKEESQITDDFARQLDLSCMSKGLVKAPSINNGYIAKYNR